MKRSAALAPLSRDHHHALEVALRLRRAEAADVEQAIAHFEDFFEREGRRHFEIEEEMLLTALPETDPEWSAAVARVREDHELIRAGISPDTRDDAERRASAAQQLGELLHDHVRFEERHLFELLERGMAPAELARLGQAITDAERTQ